MRLGWTIGSTYLLSVYSVSFARPVTAVPITTLTKQADSIVVASLVQGHQNGPEVSLVLNVMRTLKGSEADGATMAVTWLTEQPSGPVRDLPLADGLWFIQKVHSSELKVLPHVVPACELSDVYLPVAGTPPRGRYAYQPGDTIVDRILLEIAATMEERKDNPNATLSFIIGGPHAIGRSVYQRMSLSPSLDLRTLGFAGRVRNNELTALEHVATGDELENSTALFRLSDSIGDFRDQRPEAIALLGRIATTKKASSLKKSAAWALFAIHTKETLPFLAQLLMAEDRALRELAVAGFSSFVMSLPIQRKEDQTTMAWLKPGRKSGYLTEATEAHVTFGKLPDDRESEIVGF